MSNRDAGHASSATSFPRARVGPLSRLRYHRRMTLGARFESEAREQPEALERLLTQGRPVAEAVARSIRDHAPSYALVAARGSSDNAARYAQYLFALHNELTVALAVPSVHTLYDVHPDTRGALVLGISQSGQSPDVVAVLEAARRQGSLTVAITNDASSPLAAAAAHSLPLLAGPEHAVAATKTFTTSLLAIALLSAALEGREERWRELAQVPAYVRETLESNDALVVDALGDARHLVVVGRGFNYATAHELALKLKETSYVVAEPYSTADLLHGPFALIEPRFPVVLVAPSGRALDGHLELLDTLAEREALLVAISDDERVLGRAEVPVRLPNGLPEWLSPFAAAAAGQLLSLAVARRRGLNPDCPRGLSKVTRTR